MSEPNTATTTGEHDIPAGWVTDTGNRRARPGPSATVSIEILPIGRPGRVGLVVTSSGPAAHLTRIEQLRTLRAAARQLQDEIGDDLPAGDRDPLIGDAVRAALARYRVTTIADPAAGNSDPHRRLVVLFQPETQTALIRAYARDGGALGEGIDQEPLDLTGLVDQALGDALGDDAAGELAEILPAASCSRCGRIIGAGEPAAALATVAGSICRQANPGTGEPCTGRYRQVMVTVAPARRAAP